MSTAMLPQPARQCEQIPSKRPYTHRIAQGPWISERCQLCDLRLQAGEPFVHGAGALVGASLLLEEEIYHRACWRQAYGGEAAS